MKQKRHGLSIGIERVGDRLFMYLRAQGKLTHKDYEVITPMIDNALKGVKEPKVKVFFDVMEFNGWEAAAAWDDFKLGLKYGNEFDKIVVYGNKKWQKLAAKVGSWFTKGEIKFFEDEDRALSWLID